MIGMERLAKYTPEALAILRIVTALIFLAHGSQKLFGFPTPPGGMPAAFSFFWFGGALEFFGGLLILVGLFTRCVAFVLAGEMAVAYWMFHAPKSFFPGAERRRRRDPLLLHLPVSGLCRPWPMEHRPNARTLGPSLPSSF